MKRIGVFLVLLLSFILVGVVNAQDETEDPHENACYTGGDLEGKCSAFETEEEDEWAWNCGYYYASYVSGKISLEQAPETCKIIFETIVVEPISLCLKLGGSNGRIEEGEYIWLQDFPNVPDNATYHTYFLRGDASPCDVLKVDETPVIWMQTTSFVSYDTALDMCAETDPSVTWNDAGQLSDPALSGFNWYCAEFK